MANTSLVLAILFFVFTACFGAPAAGAAAITLPPGQAAYRDELVSRAGLKQLSTSRDWRLLLHYRSNLLGGFTSQADGAAFFLSPNGNTDPRAELEATIEKFFTNEPVGKTAQPAQCAFPDRYLWLKQQLAFDPARLPERRCERLDRWLAEINPASATFIFASAYLNNPSSMFGHTLLRIDQQGQTPETGILAYVINYAADADTDNAALYALLGMTGGFKGFFSTTPYYIKIQEYSDMENRDLWEYHLNFSEAQIRRLLLHAWALGNTYFNYYYFKENCSYHLLSLLEIADPSLHLTDHFPLWTLPSDTVRLIASQPGLVTSVTYRPSAFNKIQHKLVLLPPEERPLFDQLRHDTAPLHADAFTQLPARRQAALLDLASDDVEYRQMADPSLHERLAPRQQALLAARSELKIPSEPVVTPSTTGPPETGHDSMRTGVATGLQDREFFEEISVRAGYHDLLDNSDGYLPTAQIEVLGLRLRHYNTTGRNRIKDFTLLNILSLSPISVLSAMPSWTINASFGAVKEQSCGNCNAVNVDAGAGAAYETDLLVHAVLYAFAEADANAGNAFERDHQIGGGGTAGVLADLARRWKANLTVTYLSFPLGDRSSDFRSSLEQNLTLSRNLALRLDLSRRDAQDETMVTLLYYF
ncbi:MAG TPA: DUF4105 domain-containing protein [Nitrospiria bacterium]|nr:DUF4105 domain-containing protein [Nitrospiria bacterium]